MITLKWLAELRLLAPRAVVLASQGCAPGWKLLGSGSKIPEKLNRNPTLEYMDPSEIREQKSRSDRPPRKTQIRVKNFKKSRIRIRPWKKRKQDPTSAKKPDPTKQDLLFLPNKHCFLFFWSGSATLTGRGGDAAWQGLCGGDLTHLTQHWVSGLRIRI